MKLNSTVIKLVGIGLAVIVTVALLIATREEPVLPFVKSLASACGYEPDEIEQDLRLSIPGHLVFDTPDGKKIAGYMNEHGALEHSYISPDCDWTS